MFLQVVNFVPQQQAWVVERFGKYLRTLQPVSTPPSMLCGSHGYKMGVFLPVMLTDDFLCLITGAEYPHPHNRQHQIRAEFEGERY